MPRLRTLRFPIFVALVSGCFSDSAYSCSGGYGDYNPSIGCSPGAVGPNGELGNGDFVYVCAAQSAPGQDAWCDQSTQQADHLRALLVEAGIADAGGGDASTGSVGHVLPDVAVGADFQLTYQPIGSLTSALSDPKPALASFVHTDTLGTGIAQPGFLGFLVWQGPVVFDFAHLRARSVVSLSLSLSPDPKTARFHPGDTLTIAAAPQAGDGTILAGTMACTFESSDPGVATVAAQGRAGQVTGVGTGSVVVKVTCLGQSTFAPLTFGSDADGSALEASAGLESGSAEAGDEPVGDSGEAGGDDALGSNDAANSGDVGDAGSVVEAGGQ